MSLKKIPISDIVVKKCLGTQNTNNNIILTKNIKDLHTPLDVVGRIIKREIGIHDFPAMTLNLHKDHKSQTSLL